MHLHVVPFIGWKATAVLGYPTGRVTELRADFQQATTLDDAGWAGTACRFDYAFFPESLSTDFETLTLGPTSTGAPAGGTFATMKFEFFIVDVDVLTDFETLTPGVTTSGAPAGGGFSALLFDPSSLS